MQRGGFDFEVDGGVKVEIGSVEGMELRGGLVSERIEAGFVNRLRGVLPWAWNNADD